MGKMKRGYNWRARTNKEGTVDNSEAVKLSAKLDSNLHVENVAIEGPNALILPAKKQKFKAKANLEPVGKILSKKKRKQLEKIVERKQKKENRSELLEKLGQVQATPEFLNQMVSLSSVQTKGLKRQFAEDEWEKKMKFSGIELGNLNISLLSELLFLNHLAFL